VCVRVCACVRACVRVSLCARIARGVCVCVCVCVLTVSGISHNFIHVWKGERLGVLEEMCVFVSVVHNILLSQKAGLKPLFHAYICFVCVM
jgi:hypothetical protein